MSKALNDWDGVWPFVLYAVLVFLLVGAMMGVSAILGERHQTRLTQEPYESGNLTIGSARLRLYAKFYKIALFFVIFDSEAIFIFAWSVAVRELGWRGYFEILIFIGILTLALVYLWRTGGLDWGPSKKRLWKA